MKKILLGIIASVFCASLSLAQANNPYNQFGIDVVTAAKAVYVDYQNGKLNNIDQETLDLYIKKFFPEQGNISLADFNQILASFKNANNASIIKNAKYSNEAKVFLQKSLEHYSITKLVDEVQKSKIADREKKDVLCVLAINYNLIAPYFDQTETSPGKGSLGHSNYSDTVLLNRSNGYNAIIWGGIGASYGSTFGPIGTAVGGLVGLVIGGWMDEGSIRTVVVNSSSGSSGYSSGWGAQP
ncbi:hypothetical protein KIH23_11135 [Flavobacterium sp. CYK-55]|uniref:hypothetical protein n=1 Tax=Flavobacterium sp. CYK-55 TaxID=2835529 RepID=UPI001BD13565|nr:hypothetical protein [Flavobacterium sp. CYK-55]MBS7787850.1 hypothetical protein [Flavobacterium sp. CYK-55]